MQDILFTRKNERMPSTFDEQVNALLNSGAYKLDGMPHKFDSELVCVVKNGEKSNASRFQNVKEFNQFRNMLLRCPKSKNSVVWLRYPKH